MGWTEAINWAVGVDWPKWSLLIAITFQSDI
jgi:hypothetical protein